jgi:hypothetical protein
MINLTLDETNAVDNAADVLDEITDCVAKDKSVHVVIVMH